jgi:hypothetical protein
LPFLSKADGGVVVGSGISITNPQLLHLNYFQHRSDNQSDLPRAHLPTIDSRRN